MLEVLVASKGALSAWLTRQRIVRIRVILLCFILASGADCRFWYACEMN